MIQLLLGGILPGLLCTVMLMLMAAWLAKRRNYPRAPRWPTPREFWDDMWPAIPALAHLTNYLEGLRSRADLAALERLLSRATVRAADLAPVLHFGTRTYKRNTIARSDHFELVALCWRSGHARRSEISSSVERPSSSSNMRFWSEPRGSTPSGVRRA